MSEMAAAWAKERARTGENLISLIECPCCKNKVAIYYDLTARVEIVPDTIDAKPLPLPSTDDTECS